MILVFVEDHRGAFTSGGDVFAQVWQVDCRPDHARRRFGLRVRQTGVSAEEGVFTREGSLAKSEESVDIPLLDIGFFSIDVDREVEVVRYGNTERPRVQARGL